MQKIIWLDLRDGGDDLGAAAGPGDCDDPALLVRDHGGGHGGHGPLPRGDEVVLGGRHVVGGGDVGGGEIVHL